MIAHIFWASVVFHLLVWCVSMLISSKAVALLRWKSQRITKVITVSVCGGRECLDKNVNLMVMLVEGSGGSPALTCWWHSWKCQDHKRHQDSIFGHHGCQIPNSTVIHQKLLSYFSLDWSCGTTNWYHHPLSHWLKTGALDDLSAPQTMATSF